MKRNLLFLKITKKIIVSIIVLGFLFVLTKSDDSTDVLYASTSLIEGNPSEESIAILNAASQNVQPYHYLNKQSLNPTRLKQVTSDMALPSNYDEVTITWESSNPNLVINPVIENITVASPQGSVTIEIYKATIVKLPSIYQGGVAFTLTAYFHYDNAILMKTYEGTMVAIMPPDFFGGVIFTIIRYASLFIEGMLTTLGLSLAGTIIGFILAIFLVLLRLQKPTFHDKKSVVIFKQISQNIAKAYITLFRGTPMIVQASFFWYGLGLFGNALLCGLFVVSLNTAAYIAEILRGSINAVDSGQTEASRSLGLSHVQTMRYVIFPQAIKNSMPAIGNEFVINVKDTAVLSVIGIFELFNQTTKVAGIYYRQLEAYLVVALIYLVLTYTITKVLQKVEKRFDLMTIEMPSSN